jgi:hypothetical protein
MNLPHYLILLSGESLHGIPPNISMDHQTSDGLPGLPYSCRLNGFHRPARS